MSDQVDRIKEFPQDGRLWWVRCVDHYHVPHGRTASPAVEVLLSPLPNPTSLRQVRALRARKVFEEIGGSVVRPLITGMIPRLTLGSVYRDGEEVARLNAWPETFHFDLLENPAEVRLAPSVLNKWRYPLFTSSDGSRINFLDSKCLVLRKPGCTLVIPCHEVFRTLYAPHTEIALALTSGPWRQTCHRVVNPQRTGLRSDGRWQVVLRKDVPNQHAEVLANLTLNPFGMASANSIHSRFLEADGRGVIHAPLPFDSNQISIRVRCVRLTREPAVYLALSIIGLKWPDSSIQIVRGRDNDKTAGERQTPTERPKPFGGRPSNAPSSSPVVDVTSDEDPTDVGSKVRFSAEGFQWIEGPICQRLEKLESFQYVGTVTSEPEAEAESASAGTEFYGSSDSTRANYSEEAPRAPSHRFLEIVDVFVRLAKLKKIDSWTCVEPFHGDFRGEMRVWKFPAKALNSRQEFGYCAWSFLDAAVRRTALVCEVRIGDATIYWLETEVQPPEGYKSVLFCTSPTNLNECIHKLLRIGAESRGRWPDENALCSQASLRSATLWKHSYVGRNKREQGGIRTLNVQRVYDALLMLSRASGTTEVTSTGT